MLKIKKEQRIRDIRTHAESFNTERDSGPIKLLASDCLWAIAELEKTREQLNRFRCDVVDDEEFNNEDVIDFLDGDA